MSLEDAVIPAIDTGGGGGEGGGSAAADAPATEVVETPGTGGGEGGTDTPPAGTDDERLPGDTSTDEHPEHEDIEQDGRKMDQRTRDAIKKLSETDPEAAKAVRDAYFSKQSVMAEFPECKDLRQAIRSIRTQKATLEAVGGSEGIQKLQDDVKGWNTEMDQFAKGDRNLIEQLHNENPNSLMLAARNSLELLAEKNPNLLQQAMLPTFVNLAKTAELPKYLSEALKHCVDGKGQEAYDAIQKISVWLGQLEKASGDITKNRDTVDPRTRELDERENRVKQSEQQSYDREISNGVTKLNNVAMDKITKNLFSQLKLNGEGRRDFTQSLMERVWAAMKLDKQFVTLSNSIKSKGDAQRTAQFVADKFEELLPDVFDKYKNIRYPSIPNRQAAPKNGAAPNGKPAPNGKAPAAPAPKVGDATMVMKKPASHEIDWTKTTDEMYHVGRGTGEAVLTNGKRVKWQWETVQV